MAILLDNRKHNGVIPMQRRNSRSLGRSNSCNRKQNVHNSALKYESSDSANQPEVQSINSSRNGIGEGEEGTTKGRGKAISRAKCRKGSYSLGRNGSGKSNPMSSAAEGAQLVVMDSAERHCNEKILASGTIIRLPSRSSFYKMFELGSQIGQGNFSDVFLVYNSESGAKFAVKEIDKARLHGKLHFVANEIALLQRSQHKNICRLVEAYECQSLYFLMFEYAQKGDLFETIKRVGRLGEQSTAQIARQAASALAFLHRRQIVHRDLKPENILLCADSTIKLTDFGLACIVLGPLYRVCGTPTYVAPEVLTQQGYGVQVDVWSLGVILYICLAGFAPFRCTDRMQLFNQIVRARPTFEQSCWSRITFKAKQLLMAMLVGNPETRLTADQLLADEWIFSARWAWESNEN